MRARLVQGTKTTVKSPTGSPVKASKENVVEANNGLNTLIKRSIVGFSMIGIFALILYGGHLYVAMMVIILQTLIFRELVNVRYRAAAEKNIPWFRSIQWCWFLVALLYNSGDSLSTILLTNKSGVVHPLVKKYLRYHTWISFSMYALIFVLSVLSLKKGYYKYQMGQLTWTIVTLCLIVFQMKHVLENIFKGLFWMFFPASLVVCNDCFAYFCGKLFGKKFIKAKFMSLSPNKTWEGFIGAFICTLIFAFYSSAQLSKYEWMICPVDQMQLIPDSLYCTPHYVFTRQLYAVPEFLQPLLRIEHVTLRPIQWHSIIFAIFTSVISPFGGFYASAIKRAYKLKDFDSVIPGHGGFMDRMDCQFITALFATAYCSTFIWPYSTGVEAIVRNILHLPLEQQLSILDQLKQALGK